jgi:hypothetical protein
MTFNYFPYDPDDVKAMQNPAIQLFGNRLFSDQTISELLSEFLLVVFSPKEIENMIFEAALPSREQLVAWNKKQLKYAPKARLNLKLFSFLGASRLESRHKTHRSHHEQLIQRLHSQIQVEDPENKQDIIRTIENLFLGFQGAGSGRTWCAQSFLPISSGFLSGESIWKETKAENDNMDDWYELIANRSSYFDMTQHLFFARGGELLYLQVCNALRQPHSQITAWCRDGVFGLTDNEQNPDWLHTQLNESLQNLMSFCPRTLTDLAEFIDSRLDPITPECTDGTESDRRFVSAGWCNAESWMEGYLFAVDLLRLMQSNLDVVERIYLLETACSMQVLRTLAMQSMRLMNGNKPCNGPDYRLAVSAPEEKRPVIRRLSQQSVKAIEKMIFQSLRSDKVNLPNDEIERNKKLKQADRSYGSKLFVGLSKRLGFVVPKRGGGARFVLNEQLLRLLVVTTVPVGGRLTFDTFKELLERRHGLVFDAKGFDRASERLCGKGIYLPADTDLWLQEMLEAAGFLIHLSDSCALIHNPADDKEDVQ